MADNITITGTTPTGQVIRTVEIAGIDYQVVIIADGTTGAVIGTTLLANGRGQNVVVLNESACKGVDLVGDDLTGTLPLLNGAYACTSLANAVYQTDNRMQMIKVTGDGRVTTYPYTVPEDQAPTTPVTLTTTADTTLLGAPAADQKWALLGAAIINLSTTVDSSVIFKVAGNPVWEVAAPRLGVTPPSSAWPQPVRGPVGTAVIATLRANNATGVIVYPAAYRTKG